MKNKIAQLTSKLISFDTTTGNNKEIAQAFLYIKSIMKGFSVKQHTFNGVPNLVISKTPQKKFKILMITHIDVVPALKEQFKPVLKGTKLYGRGAADMKGSVATALLLMKNSKPDDVGLIISGDEETGGLNGAEKLAKMYKADFILGLEPTGESIITEKKGVMWIQLKAKGKSGHASEPWNGENAIDNVIAAYQEIKKSFPKKYSKKDYWKKTLSIGTINAGKACNVIPGTAELGLDVRFTKDDNVKALQTKIRNSAKKHNCLAIIHFVDPCFTDKTNNFVKQLKKITKAKVEKETGSSDVRPFNKTSPAVDYGPIDHNIHAKGEYVDIRSLERVYQNLSRFLK